MTAKTKTVIELPDLGAIRLECKNCEADVSFPISTVSLKVPRVCPACNVEWIDLYDQGKPWEIAAVFLDNYKLLMKMLGKERAVTVGFDLKLELKAEVSSARASIDRG